MININWIDIFYISTEFYNILRAFRHIYEETRKVDTQEVVNSSHTIYLKSKNIFCKIPYKLVSVIQNIKFLRSF